jgi:UDP-glucose 4-epimerase
VFGPRQDAASPYSGVIARFIPAILRGERPVVYGDGSQSRDFVYVANVVEANLRAAQIEGIGGQVFNVATGRRTTVSETLDHIGKITGRKVVPRYEPARQGDILHSQADATRAEQYLGWRPTVDFVEGLEFTVDWYRRNLRTVAAPDAG